MKLVDIPISKRLWAAVILPMLSAGYLSYAQISERLADYHNMNEVVVIGDQLKKLSGIAHALQVERGLTAGFIGSKGTKNIGELAAARKDTDGMVDGFPGISEVLLNVAGNSFSARQSSARKICLML